MKNLTLNENDVFLMREFDICDENGEVKSIVTVKIGKPSEDIDGSWVCPYCISGLDEIEPSIFKVKGIDSVQSLLGVFKVIEGTLSGSDVAKHGTLWWYGHNKPPFLR